GRVIKVAAAQLVEADDQRRVESAGAVEDFQNLRRIDGKRVLARQFLRIRITRQKALGEADDFDPVALGPFQPLDDLGEIAVEIAALRFVLAVADAHRRLQKTLALPSPLSTGERGDTSLGGDVV